MIKLYLLYLITLAACQTKQAPIQQSVVEHKDEIVTMDSLIYPDRIVPVEKSEEEWKKILSDQGYYVLRQKGTERAFTGKYWNNKDRGVYTCAACALPLFTSETKYDSGTGWPSYYQPIKNKYITEHVDKSFGSERVEVVCARCGGHLGHVFPDGPKPTGLRYCINSVSLNFVKK